MSMTLVEDADSRQNLGPSGIIQQNKASFASDDYPTGGYPINPQAWGLGLIRGLVVVAKTGTALNFLWDFVPATTPTSTLAGTLYVSSVLGTQAAAATDLSGGTVKLLAYGF